MASPLIKILTRSEFLARKLRIEKQLNLFVWIIIMLSLIFAFAFVLSNQTCLSDGCAKNIAANGYDEKSMETRHRYRDDDDKHDRDLAGSLNSSFGRDIQTFDVGDSGRKNGNRSGGFALK